MPVARLAVMAAAGKGQRILPHSLETSKSLIEVGGKSLMARNLELLRDAMQIQEVLIVVGHLKEQIEECIGDGSTFGMKIRYVTHPRPDDGLGSLFRYVQPFIDEPFVLTLADELYLNSNHAQFARPERDYRAVVALLCCSDRVRIACNYGVRLQGERVLSLVEKPTGNVDSYLGCGTYLCPPTIFEDAEATPISARSGRLELTDILNTAAQQGAVLPFFLEGDYCNVNTPEDLSLARRLCP